MNLKFTFESDEESSIFKEKDIGIRSLTPRQTAGNVLAARLKWLILLAVTAAIRAAASVPPSCSAMVDGGYTSRPGALVDGKPVYRTIGEALQTVPACREGSFIIFIRKGIYHEKISIDANSIHLIGEDRDSTVITFDAAAGAPAPDGKPYGTRGCFTLAVMRPDFRAENLTIENSFDYPENAARPDKNPSKITDAQGVAVMTAESSDRAVFINCVIRGYQDTLFPDAGRHYFLQCRILGHVDFIFGAGQAVFEDCDIVSRDRKGKDPTGYITAPSTPISFPYGFLFLDCCLLRETPDLPAGSVRLGRPWHPGADPAASGSAVFIRCLMEDHIGPEGYAPISSRDTTGRKIIFDLEKDSRFFEFHSHGPGALESTSRPQLDEKAAAWYQKEYVLNGWKPWEEMER
ncbi:pectinesterase A [bacterium]|nr:pectinesterase A [bacterium]